MTAHLKTSSTFLNQFILQLVCIFAFYGMSYSQDSHYLKVVEDVALENNPEKIKAIKYLVQNVPGKVYYDGKDLRNFDQLFPIMQEIQKLRRVENQDRQLQGKMDSLVKVHGKPALIPIEILEDKNVLTSDFLLDNLNLAFKVKYEKKWLVNIPDELFYEYVLPYRVGTERLEEHQRALLYDTYNFIKKSNKVRQEAFNETKSTDLLKFASNVQYEISRKISTNGSMWDYPFDIPISKMEQGRQGACRHLVNYTTAAMRAVGLPVASDFTIRWGNSYTGHKWNVLFLENGKELPFDAANATMSFSLKDRKIAKVYREQFSKNQDFTPPPKSDVPRYLYNVYWKDVTKKYCLVTDVKINVPKEVIAKKSFVLIGTFNNSQWQPQFFAKIVDGKAEFNEMGVDNIYIGMYYEEGMVTTFGDPFKIDYRGRISYLSPKSKVLKLVNLVRKYPRTSWVDTYESSMVGGKFEYSVDENFPMKESSHTIKFAPDSVTKIQLKSGKYRWARYVFPDSPRVYIAEISFFNRSELISARAVNSDVDVLKINDGDLNTYHWGRPGGAILYDFGEPISIESIAFAPRSDSNFIVVGNNYELCYWKGNDWVSLGSIIATSSTLQFKSVPKNALLILHNLTKGKEERIFTYEAGKQVWW